MSAIKRLFESTVLRHQLLVAVAGAAKRGFLIKVGEYLECADKISAVALNKTGTLTRANPTSRT